MKLPGYILNDYKLVIPLPEAMEQKIHGIRKDFGETYQHKAEGGRPHLTLLMFSQLEMMEERIVQRLKTIGMAGKPFKLEMKDYGSYPSHTIFINVVTKEPVKQLMRSVKEIQRLLRTDNEHKAHFLNDPMISIARKLKPWQYEKSWLEYTHRQFTGKCIADAMLLLKRREGTLSWQIVRRFEFEGIQVASQQQELF
jgi:2'-5' RNA ligase